MRYFLTLLFLRLKSSLRSRLFVVTAAFVLALTLILSVALPRNAPLSLRVGVLSQGARGENAAALLAQNSDYEMVRYGDRAALEHDVLTGALHCGYLLVPDAKKPVTVLQTDASYMRPLLDEVVLAALFEVNAPDTAADFLTENGFNAANAHADFERIRGETKPLEITLLQTGRAGAPDALAARRTQPLLYAVLAAVFPAAALITALLADKNRAAGQRYLAVCTRRPIATALAPVAANVLLNCAVLCAADLCINAFAEATAYTLSARLTALGALAVFSTLAALCGGMLRRFAGVVMAVLPPLLLVGVLCSGAILNPALLPAPLGAMQFLSPAWYVLRLLVLS